MRVENILTIVGDDTIRCIYSSISILQTLIRAGFEQYDNSRSVASVGKLGKYTDCRNFLLTMYSIVLPICDTCKSDGAKIVVGRFTHNGKEIQERLDQPRRREALAATS